MPRPRDHFEVRNVFRLEFLHAFSDGNGSFECSIYGNHSLTSFEANLGKLCNLSFPQVPEKQKVRNLVQETWRLEKQIPKKLFQCHQKTCIQFHLLWFWYRQSKCVLSPKIVNLRCSFMQKKKYRFCLNGRWKTLSHSCCIFGGNFDVTEISFNSKTKKQRRMKPINALISSAVHSLSDAKNQQEWSRNWLEEYARNSKVLPAICIPT